MPGLQVEGGVVAWNLDGASIRSMDPRPQQEDWPQHPPFDTPSSRRCSRICRHGQMNFWPGTAIDATAGNIVSKVPTGIAGRSSAMAASVSPGSASARPPGATCVGRVPAGSQFSDHNSSRRTEFPHGRAPLPGAVRYFSFVRSGTTDPACGDRRQLRLKLRVPVASKATRTL